MTNARILLFVLCFFIVQHTFGQYSNLRCKWVKPSESGVRLDTLSIVPGSIEVKVPYGYTSMYNVGTNLITFSPMPLPDSLLICYRVYPFDLSKKVYKRNLSLYDSVGGYREIVRPYGYNGNMQQREELFTTPGINKTGVISRGISAGNNQSVFVNSTLNLQLDGKLTDNLMLTAVISDQNIPFQPEGNTQQIQQFDRVYIQLKSPRAVLTVGDIVLNQQSYFLKYYRNVSGGHVSYTYKKDSLSENITQGAIGVSKGKFNTMQFAPGSQYVLQEGVQGPYRLRGPNNETFISVIANSEKVYMDGRLMTRGFDYDYIIDYNTAELTFTPRVLITRFTRVRIDFEFTDRNYSRTNTAFSQSVKTKSGQYSVSYYSEKDNPNHPLTVDLSQADQLYLSTIGDDLSKAVINGVDSVGYSANATLYKKIKVGTEDVYQYSTSPDSAFFQVKFSQVLEGMGSYVLNTSTANARIFNYVGLPNGNYLPVQVVPTPKKKQMIQGSIVQNTGKYEQVFGDIAYSTNDVNLYSTLASENDNGTSIRAGIKSTNRKTRLSKNYLLSSLLSYEFNQENFSAVDRFRGPDFERYWNENTSIIGNNHMATGNFKYAKNANELVSYTLNYRNKENDLLGLQHQAQLYQKAGNIFFKGDAFYMNSSNYNPAGKAHWERYNLQLFYQARNFTPGVQYNTEKNEVTDSLGKVTQSLMYFDEYKFYLQSNDTSKFKFRIDQAFRNDKQVFLQELLPYTSAQTTNFTTGVRFNPNHQINFLTTYRYLSYVNVLSPTPNDETILSRLDWNVAALKRHVRSELTVTTGTGRQAKQQFVFQPVATGLGTYVWRDFNSDGQQQINEFVTKIYPDTAEFIKVYLPTNDYYKAYSSAINYRLDLTMPRSWKTSSKQILLLASRLSNTSSIAFLQKTTNEDVLNRFNPFAPTTIDTTLLSYQRTIRSALFYNRASSLFGMDLALSSNKSRQFLTQGFESQFVNDLTYGVRTTFKRMYALKIKLSTGVNSVISDFNPYRNYYIVYKEIGNEFSYQPRTNFRLSALGGFGYKENTIPSGNGENSLSYNIGSELKWNKLSKRTFTGTLKYIRINSRLNGTSQNSPIAYEMQNALMAGNNMTWNIVWQERLTNGLQLSFSYEGRKSEGTKTIHTGRMQLSALF